MTWPVEPDDGDHPILRRWPRSARPVTMLFRPQQRAQRLLQQQRRNMNAQATEKLMSFGHKFVVTGLIGLSIWGLVFIGGAGVDIYTRYKERKRINEAKKAASQ